MSGGQLLYPPVLTIANQIVSAPYFFVTYDSVSLVYKISSFRVMRSKVENHDSTCYGMLKLHCFTGVLGNSI